MLKGGIIETQREREIEAKVVGVGKLCCIPKLYKHLQHAFFC